MTTMRRTPVVGSALRIDLGAKGTAAPSDLGGPAKMWEIAENLHRAELTVAERSEHIAEWIRLCDDQSAQVAPIESKRAGIKAQVEPKPTGVGSLRPFAEQPLRGHTDAAAK